MVPIGFYMRPYIDELKIRISVNLPNDTRLIQQVAHSGTTTSGQRISKQQATQAVTDMWSGSSYVCCHFTLQFETRIRA